MTRCFPSADSPPSPQGHPVTLQISNFQGGSAFSTFKTSRLLSRLQAECDALEALQASHVYLLASERKLSAEDTQRLAQLLDAQPGQASAPVDAQLLL